MGTVATPYSRAWPYVLSHRKPVMLQGTKSHLPGSKAGTLPTASRLVLWIQVNICSLEKTFIRINPKVTWVSKGPRKGRSVSHSQRRTAATSESGSSRCHCPCALCILGKLKASLPRTGGFDGHWVCWKVSNFYKSYRAGFTRWYGFGFWCSLNQAMEFEL